MTNQEIAAKLYGLCEDMDATDYAETKQDDIDELERALDIINMHTEEHPELKTLLTALETAVEFN